MLEKSGYTLDEIETETAVSTNTDTKSVHQAVSPFDHDDQLAKNEIAPSLSENILNQQLSSQEEWDERLQKFTHGSYEIMEAFRTVRAKILQPQDGRTTPRSIMVTSVLPSEGKSFVTANLGVSLAQGVDQHSLLVDCDLRFPSLAPLFGVSQRHGLVDYLQKDIELSSLIQKTSVFKLSILAGGHPPANPAELLGSARMHDLVDDLSTRYSDRFVIFDTPPLQVASESMILSQAVDAVILVVRHGISGRSLIEKFIGDIGKEKIIGVIFNGHNTNPISSRFVDKSHYYYGNYYNKRSK